MKFLLVMFMLSGERYVLDVDLTYEDCRRAAIRWAPANVACEVQRDITPISF